MSSVWRNETFKDATLGSGAELQLTVVLQERLIDELLSEKGELSISVAQSPRGRPPMSCFVHNPKNIQFTVKEERNQKIFTFKKLESENFNELSSEQWVVNLILDN